MLVGHDLVADRRPRPGDQVQAPFVTPASSSASTSRTAHSGASRTGLEDDAVAANQGRAVFHAGMAMGKFQGVISSDDAQSGGGRCGMRTRSRSDGPVRP